MLGFLVCWFRGLFLVFWVFWLGCGVGACFSGSFCLVCLSVFSFVLVSLGLAFSVLLVSAWSGSGFREEGAPRVHGFGADHIRSRSAGFDPCEGSPSRRYRVRGRYRYPCGPDRSGRPMNGSGPSRLSTVPDTAHEKGQTSLPRDEAVILCVACGDVLTLARLSGRF